MKSEHRISIILMALILFFGWASLAEAIGQEPLPPNPYTINVNVGLTVLPVSVVDNKNHRVSGLTKDNFQVFEDGRRQDIALFEDKDAPVTIAFVVDNSMSMQPKHAAVLAAATAFAESSNPSDEIFVVNFNQAVHVELPAGVPFTRSPEELRSALSIVNATGRTALYDAIAAALDHLKMGTGGKKYVIVVSDGGDNASHLSKSDILAMAKSSNAAIYSVAILDENYSDQDPSILRKLSHVSGGEFYSPETVPGVIETLKLIARDIRQQYTLGYIPSNQAEGGKFHAVKVTASLPGEGKLTVHTRSGYLAPAETSSQAGALETPAPKP
ncbi:MAG TPA: VWA domain-containing protein [Terriglobia bacterium]|nr:VWA domain-containing protein [Terriglobia bacterium]